MSKKLRNRSKGLVILLAAILGIGTYTCASVFAKQDTSIHSSAESLKKESVVAQNNARYLELYFGIHEVPEVISGAFLEEAMNKVSDTTFNELATKETVTYVEAIKYAVKGAHFEELALGYSKEKVEARKLPKLITTEEAAYVACALDTGLISEEALSDIDQAIGREQAIDLLMAVAEANGKARNFLGYTNEEAIYGKLLKAWNETTLFENEKLESIGEQAVMNGVVTGYNLLNRHYSANFIPELTLRYGHSTTLHATQLIGLLNSEGIVAKVQLEPKTSIFEYLPEWGDVPPATPDYRVEVVNENFMLAHSLEYDLVFEFETLEDKIRFNDLIETYAKKDDENPEGEGLLLASWWQPLYVSTVEMGEGYKAIYNNVVTDGNYSLNPFCIAEDKEEVLNGLKAIDPSVEVEQTKIWCNDAFYRYLSGESHQ